MSARGMLINARIATMREGMGPYGLIENAALCWQDGLVTYCGPMAGLPDSSGDAVDCEGGLVTPALIDCHTHLIFAGDRAREFEQRLEGVSYEQIARNGGGILSTVRATRAADNGELLLSGMRRMRALMQDGVSTIEIKSGYGLDLDTERRILNVARALGTQMGMTIRTTYLGAHALPPEFANRPDDYIDAACDWLRTLHAEGLVDAVDAFCEGIGFSPAQTRRMFDTARALGLPVKLHADQLSDLGGAALSAEFGGLSADHLEYTSEAAVAAMASSGTVAVLLPGAYHLLRETRLPPIDAFRRHGVPMAVSTDFNPGTSPLLSLRLAMSLACTHFRLTPEEALRGTTVHAAKALGLADRGQLSVGMRADFATWQLQHPAELSYWMGSRDLERLHIGGRHALPLPSP